MKPIEFSLVNFYFKNIVSKDPIVKLLQSTFSLYFLPITSLKVRI